MNYSYCQINVVMPLIKNTYSSFRTLLWRTNNNKVLFFYRPLFLKPHLKTHFLFWVFKWVSCKPHFFETSLKNSLLLNNNWYCPNTQNTKYPLISISYPFPSPTYLPKLRYQNQCCQNWQDIKFVSKMIGIPSRQNVCRQNVW